MYDKKRVTRAGRPSHPRVRHVLASNPSVTAVGAPWRRIPGQLLYRPASSAPLPVLVPADAHGSTQYAEPAPLPTPSTSGVSFRACCTLSQLTARPHPSASPSSPSLGTT